MKHIRTIVALTFALLIITGIRIYAADCVVTINGVKSDAAEAQAISSGLRIGKNVVNVKYTDALASQKNNIKTVLALFCDGVLSDVEVISSTPVAKNAYIPYATVNFNVAQNTQNYYIKPFFFEDFEALKILDNKGKETVEAGLLAENKIVVDGTALEVTDGEQTFNDPSWLYLEENNGYVFLQNNADIKVKRELRSGNTFAVITDEHGKNPQNAQYAYAIIPHASQEETKAFAEAPSVTLLEVSENVHALYDSESNKYYINVFSGSYAFKVVGVTLSVCSAIINKKDSTTYEFYIADPTHSKAEITVDFASEIQSVSGTDASFVTCEGTALSVNTQKRPGSTFAFTVKI